MFSDLWTSLFFLSDAPQLPCCDQLRADSAEAHDSRPDHQQPVHQQPDHQQADLQQLHVVITTATVAVVSTLQWQWRTGATTAEETEL